MGTTTNHHEPLRTTTLMSWFMVVRSGSWWFNVMVRGGLWWFDVMVHGGS